MKKCRWCNESKPPVQFRVDRRSQSGIGAICRKCSNQSNKTFQESQKQLGLCRMCARPNVLPITHKASLCLYHWCHQATNSILRQAKLNGITLAAQDFKRITNYLYDKAQTITHCPYTNELLVPGINMAVDHILPIKHHPDLIIACSNLEFICSDCNFMKRAFSKQEFINRCQLIAKNNIKERTVCLL